MRLFLLHFQWYISSIFSIFIVLKRYETNPITIFRYVEYAQWHELFVKIVGIVGGVFTIGVIIDGMVHSSILFLVEKHRLNKLR